MRISIRLKTNTGLVLLLRTHIYGGGVYNYKGTNWLDLSQLGPGNHLICGAPIGPLWLANKFNYLNERCSSTLEEADNNTLVHQNNYPCPSAPIALPQISKSRFSTRVCFWSVKEAMSFPLLPFLITPLISAPLSTLCAKVIKTLQFLGTMQCCIKRKVILCNPSRVTAH